MSKMELELHDTKPSCKGCVNLNKVYYFIGPVAVRECDCEIGFELGDPFGEPFALTKSEYCEFKEWP